MMLIAIGFLSFWILIVVFELYTGSALIGWSADRMLVERAKSPGPYWFAIGLHIVICVGLPALYLVAG